MKIGAILWASYVPVLTRAAARVRDLGLEVRIFSSRTLEAHPEKREEALVELARADIILLYRSGDSFWEEILPRLTELGNTRPLVSLGYDPAYLTLSNVSPEVVQKALRYVLYGGEENFVNLLLYLASALGGLDVSHRDPEPLPLAGIYHPRAPKVFTDTGEYLAWYRPSPGTPLVGILYSRHNWVNGEMEVERALIEEFEAQGLGVIPVFSYSVKDESLGSEGPGEAIRKFLLADGLPRIEALIKLVLFFLGSTREKDLSDPSVSTSGVEVLRRLGVPVFQPVVAYYRTVSEWEEDPRGLSAEVAWSVALPEFEGVIEPLFIGAMKREEDPLTGAVLERRVPVRERVRRLVRRVKAWIELRCKPPAERRVVLVLHNNPCASVEATVGAGAHLDTLESVARILKRLRLKGYRIEGEPENGKELIDLILKRKAISEFRWTTVEEIVKKGGALAMVPLEEYLSWWEEFPEEVRLRMREAWGEPPGEEKNGVPAAMVHEGKIVVTGLRFGNAVVCVQPKRGCAGPRCDGKVCKILHDPEVPPPHQYVATYRWLERVFGADVIIHVGTHGNLEFLPGKGVGLSASCFPDLSIHERPHLYIYNSDNPPEGTIAKRRSYAVLVDHLQTVLEAGGLYEGYLELDRLLEEYERAAAGSPARAHEILHRLVDLVRKTGLDREVNSPEEIGPEEFVRRIHEALTRLRSTQVPRGMHIFGEIPRGERLAEFIRAVLRHDSGEPSDLRRVMARALGFRLEDLLQDPSRGRLLERVEKLSGEFVRGVLDGKKAGEVLVRLCGKEASERIPAGHLEELVSRIKDLKSRIEASDEMGALLYGISGGYIPPGPSGLITRGRDDILPTGRNFYSLDPERVPTKAAYAVGVRLAEALLEKFRKDEGRLPENVAFYWMCTDIMWSEGEVMSQILYLLGVRPVWLPNGRIKGLEVIPLHELGRPRIDVTIRVSGITRDNFPRCLELVDEAVCLVAELEEPPEMNFVRRHTLERLEKLGGRKDAFRRATFRLFASPPGTYQSGVNLAVYASAWKTEKDLAEVFLYWNGYAYGKGVFGEKAHREFAEGLRTVEATFNNSLTDEYDLFGCCCYFGTHGGLTVAARELSGKRIRAYYGDTRERAAVEVRDLADEIRRVARAKLLNPRWIEGMKQHGYKGAAEISKRIGRLFGWQATTGEVDDWIFDEITRKFVVDRENREFLMRHNPYALEEIARRLLEAEKRGLWKPEAGLLEKLRDAYLELEGRLEDAIGETGGDFQGGAVDMYSADEVAEWQARMKDLRREIGEMWK
ncbi:cobaltochelatase subunit CobN [Thermosulfurimonas sp. F29]|uniref:cobaltochelatase subunit CobN n=1 Tax=Thermosulfurimonas sp. F29 TaxID=2867247 RepID=UPI001C83743C|nr:cobaltochelatase subunit CobN [Thermosulfurimonas sp. F29]MBX6423118.1 cobaltochelatase subunit CobN [Thermosulfurimonas sp. F29]